MKCHAAFAFEPALGIHKNRLTIVLFPIGRGRMTRMRDAHTQAEIEKDRMKFSNANRVGLTNRPARVREIVQGLLANIKDPGATTTHVDLRRVRF